MKRNVYQKLYYKDLKKAYQNFDGIIFDNVIGDIQDLQVYFSESVKVLGKNDRILVSYHNPNWEPILTLASQLGLRKKVGLQNWLDEEDIKNILRLSGFEIIKTEKRFFAITMIVVAKPNIHHPLPTTKTHSVSIIIPARNEEGNIKNIIPSIPKFGKSQEIIFVEGNSTDNTWEEINKQIRKYTNLQIKVKGYKQKGKGKADAAWLGMRHATGDILMIYDADRTVPAGDLPKFFNALASQPNEHIFANGNRLMYPMETGAMQFLNKLGNQFFGSVFTWILGQRFKDTLCGTKVFWRRDFKKFKRSKTDPFGDFDLIFGAIRNNLKVVEIPIRYKERVYGHTNINRFYHGLLLIKMAILALLEFKLFGIKTSQRRNIR